MKLIKRFPPTESQILIKNLILYLRHSPKSGFHKVECQKRIEKFLLENEGFVALYGETELTKEEFYEMFEDAKNNYDRIRKKYDCEDAFPHVYNKISKLGRN